MKIVLKVLAGILSVVVIICASYIGINEGLACYAHHSIAKKYSSTEEPYIYIENGTNEESIILNFNDVLDSIPQRFSERFKNKWVVIVSKNPPKHFVKQAPPAGMKLSGLTFPGRKAIWISSDNEGSYKDVFAHEIGHYLAHELEGTDYNEAFKQIYREYKDVYIQHDMCNVSKYHGSSTAEFYATLCKEYICDQEYLSENCSDGFKYIKNDLGRDPYSWFLGGYISEAISTVQFFKNN